MPTGKKLMRGPWLLPAGYHRNAVRGAFAPAPARQLPAFFNFRAAMYRSGLDFRTQISRVGLFMRRQAEVRGNPSTLACAADLRYVFTDSGPPPGSP